MGAERARVGIVGAGGMGASQASAFSRIAGLCQVVAICDQSPDAIHAARRQIAYAVDAYDDYIAMLDRADLDAVVIVLPHHLHHWASIAALERGISVLCEKPGGHNLLEIKDIAHVTEQSGAIWVIGLVKRFYRPVEMAEAIINSGQLGEVFNIVINDESRHQSMRDRFGAGWVNHTPDWRSVSKFMGGGITNDTAFHTESLALALMPARPYEVAYVDDRGGKPLYLPMEGPDTLDFRLSFGDKGRAIGNVSWSMNAAGEPLLRVDGTKGQLVGRFIPTANGSKRESLEWTQYGSHNHNIVRHYNWSPYSDLRLQAADFLRCVRYPGIWPSRNGLPHALEVAELRDKLVAHSQSCPPIG